jgi:hypothetical protein
MLPSREWQLTVFELLLIGNLFEHTVLENPKESGTTGLSNRASNGLKTKQDRLLRQKTCQARAADARTMTQR